MLEIILKVTKKDAREIARLAGDSISQTRAQDEQKIWRKIVKETQKALKAD